MNYTLLISCLYVFCCMCFSMKATILTVGIGQQFPDPRTACLSAKPGDTVLMYPAEYKGAYFIENINGIQNSPITIRGIHRDSVVFSGGSESFHFSDCSYLIIENFTIKGQTSNGMNCDDAGTFDTPAHHVIFRNLTFSTMNASGNNDQLKLSGLDDFIIEDCIFQEGAAGGSGVDMVGCHNGVFRKNTFIRQGSNCIQAKGGTRFIRIEHNSFIDGGQRALNLGGSTGLQFFRPLDAPFEAADMLVHANLFVRSTAPLAFVGSVRVTVQHNTIIDPERWVFRILQETVDTNRFLACGNNVFQNNLIVFKSSISRQVNIGGNTDPASFLLRNNLWYNIDIPTSSILQEPQLKESGGIYGKDPLLMGYTNNDYHILPESPARGAGFALSDTLYDYENKPFKNPPSIGAFESKDISAIINESLSKGICTIRTLEGIWLTMSNDILPKKVSIIDLNGAISKTLLIESETIFIPLEYHQFLMW